MTKDKPIIVFSSDNAPVTAGPLHDTDKYPGWHFLTPRLGSNGSWRGQKSTLYEGGIRTPSVISWPGMLTPHRCESAVHVADWMPTFCNLAGARPDGDPQWDGQDIWDVVTGKSQTDPDRHFYWNFRGSQYCVRQGDYKLIHGTHENAQAVELYNIVADPQERENLADERPELTARLAGIMEQEQAQDDRCKRADV